MTQDDSSRRRVLLGHIAGAHGIRGAVIVRSYTGDPEAIADYGSLENEEGDARFSLAVEGVTAKGLICRVEGVADRTAAERLKGTALYVERAKLPPADEGEYYYVDLIGLRAVSEAGDALGSVVAVQNYGAGDILEIRPDGDKRTLLFSMNDNVVRRVDVAGGVIVVAPPEEVDAGDEGMKEADDA